jgi:hypothetical protein
MFFFECGLWTISQGVWGWDPISYCYFNGDEANKYVFLLHGNKQNNKYNGFVRLIQGGQK